MLFHLMFSCDGKILLFVWIQLTSTRRADASVMVCAYLTQLHLCASVIMPSKA